MEDLASAPGRRDLAAAWRADAALIVTPYYNKPTPEGMLEHYKAVAGATSLPVVLYNVPGRTGINVDVPTLVKIAKACPNVVAVKEASGNISQMAEIVHRLPHRGLRAGAWLAWLP